MPAELLPSELPANERRGDDLSPALLPSDPSAAVSDAVPLPTVPRDTVPRDTVPLPTELADASRLSPAERIAGGAEEVTASENPETVHQPSPSPPTPLPQEERGVNEDQARRELRSELLQTRLLDRLDRSRRLPPGLKQRLAAEIPSAAAGADGSELPSLRLSDAIAWLEESLPAHVTLAPDALDRPDHPRGESFFRDDASGLTDSEAERIAREQVSRAGLGKK